MDNPGRLRAIRYSNDPERSMPALLLFYCVGCNDQHYFRIRTDPLYADEPIWTWNGSWEAPTFSPSLICQHRVAGKLVTKCHLFLREGVITYLSDCAHSMAGKSIPMPEWPEALG